MSQGMFSIGGIASGLDTATIIEQLMALEKAPVANLQRTQERLRGVDAAWVQINARLSGLRAATDAIARPDRFESMISVTSSDTNAVSVSRGSGSGAGSLSFSVEQLAQSHQIASGSFASRTDALGVEGRVELQVSGRDAVGFDVAAGDTLDTLVARINQAKGGVTASVVREAEGVHRLVLTSTENGAGRTISITGPEELEQLDVGQLRELRTAQDAHVRVGSGPQSLLLTRTSNTIDDLVPGASVTLKQVTDGRSVTVSATRDTSAAVTAIKGYVDALNGAITLVSDLSSYDATANRAGVLQGNTTARQLLADLRSAATAPLGVELPGFSNAHQVGLSVDRFGKVQLDETKLRAALAEDFDAVGRLFSRRATTTSPHATGVVGTAATAAGTYAVEVTTAATVASVTGGVVSPPDPDANPKTLRVQSGGKTVEIVFDDRYATTQAVVDALNEKLTAAGVNTLRASRSELDELQLHETRYGSTASFTVSVVDGDGQPLPDEDGLGLVGTHTGADVRATVRRTDVAGGTPVQVVGRGRQLEVTEGPAKGLSLTYTGAAPGQVDVGFTHGLAGGMSVALRRAEGVDGSIARARNGLTSQIKLYQTRIDAFDVRLATRESTLRRQFTAMESALHTLNGQSSWLSSQLTALYANSAPR
ncbi:hypothetical protein FTX61_18315 [Nitriliruptoraceae bacterium ZYF776]|nr:hypothetical protein [Profundirhabdus halotolerans]